MLESWSELESVCKQCNACGLCRGRTNVVFGVGCKEADVMFIGEGPGEQEDIQGEPFVGPAGKLLDTMLEIIDLDRSKVYIANIVKCRPPQNRDPQDAEKDACREWLQRQIALVDPKIIVCLGRISATDIIRDDFKISREHGQWFSREGRIYMAMYHPSALLRDPSKRPVAFEDLIELRRGIRALCERTY